MNDTPQGDGNASCPFSLATFKACSIRMNDTPQGDGNFLNLFYKIVF